MKDSYIGHLKIFVNPKSSKFTIDQFKTHNIGHFIKIKIKNKLFKI